MKTKEEITRLLKRAKGTSVIRFLPYNPDPPESVKNINTALLHAENEETRWNLFLALLEIWNHRRAPQLGIDLFGFIALWDRREIPIILMERDGLVMGQGPFTVVQITGANMLTNGYYLELIKRKLVQTLQDHCRKNPIL